MSPQFEDDLVEMRACPAAAGLREQLFPNQNVPRHQKKKKNQRKKCQTRRALVERVCNGHDARDDNQSCARTTAWAGGLDSSRVGCGAALEWSCARVRIWKRAGLTRSQDISLYRSAYNSTVATPLRCRMATVEEEGGLSHEDEANSPLQHEDENSSRTSSEIPLQNLGLAQCHINFSAMNNSTTGPANSFISPSTDTNSCCVGAGHEDLTQLEQASTTDAANNSGQASEVDRSCKQGDDPSELNKASKQGVNDQATCSNNLRVENLSDLFSSMSVDEDKDANSTKSAIDHGNSSVPMTTLTHHPQDSTRENQPSPSATADESGGGSYLDNLEGFVDEFDSDMTELSLHEAIPGRRDVSSSGTAAAKGILAPNPQDTLAVGAAAMPPFRPSSFSTPFRAASSNASSNPHHATLFSMPLHPPLLLASEMMECGQQRDDSTRMDDNDVSGFLPDATSGSGLSLKASASFDEVGSGETGDSSLTRLDSDWSYPESCATISPLCREPLTQASVRKSILKKRNPLRQFDSETANRTLSKSVTFKLPLTDSSSGDFGSSSTGSSSILALETPEHLWQALPLDLARRKEREDSRILDAARENGLTPGVTAQVKSSAQPHSGDAGLSMGYKHLETHHHHPIAGDSSAGLSPGQLWGTEGACSISTSLEMVENENNDATTVEHLQSGLSAPSVKSPLQQQQPWDIESSLDAKMDEFFSQNDKLSQEEGTSILAMETPAYLWASPPVNFINSTFN